MKTYVVADVAGRSRELLKLIAQFEQPCKIVQAGDIVDRGSESCQVIEYLMAHPEITVLCGNHEHMMLDYCRDFGEYDRETWLWNGGDATMESFGGKVPEEVLVWLEGLQQSCEVEVDGKLYLITHAPTPDPNRPWDEYPQWAWNRYAPKRNPKYALQIYGHNSHLEWEADAEGTYAVCIDDCRGKHLTAIELPSQRLLRQPYET